MLTSRRIWLAQSRVVRPQPGAKLVSEPECGGKKLRQIAIGHRVIAFIGGQIAAAPEGVEFCQNIHIDPESQRQALQCERVMPGLVSAGAVAAGSQRHGSDAQQRVISRGEAALGTKLFEPRVRQAAVRAAQQALHLVALCFVPMQLSDLH